MKFSRRLAVLCFSLILAVSSVGLIVSMANTYATTVEMVTTDLDTSNLSYGSKYTFPATIKQEYKGEQRDFTNGTVVFPSGSTYLAGKELTLSEVGMYTVRYYYQDGANAVTSLKQFIINDCYYEMPSDVNTYSLSTENINDNEAYKNYFKNYKELDGLSVTLKEGSEFVYNKPINLKETYDEGAGMSKVIQINPLGINRELKQEVIDNFGKGTGYNSNQAFDINSVKSKYTIVRITDAYDPTLFVEYEFYMGSYIYIKSGANGQLYGGMVKCEENTSTSFTKFKIGEQWWYIRTSLLGVGSGIGNGVLPEYFEGYQLYFDTNSNSAYFKPVHSDYNKPSLINKLDVSQVYKDNIFNGFTTGEVYVSVYAKDFIESTTRVDVLSIGNDTGTDIKNAYNQYSYVDEIAPVIKVDVQVSDEFGIYKALGETFEIPEAYAYDVNINGIPRVTDITAYRNYGTDNEFIVSIKNNTILLDKQDVYTIVYKAVDSYGNVGTNTLNVIPKTVASGKAITLTYDKLTDTVDGGKLKAGVETVMPEYTISTLNNVDYLHFKQSIIYEDGTELEIYNDGNVNKFLPLNSGKYTVKYVYYDNVSSFEESYEIECIPSNAVKNLGEPTMYKYFIAGQDYSLEPYNVYTFKNKTPTSEETEMFVKIKTDGEFSSPTKVANINKFSVPSDATAIKFLYRHDNVILYETEEIPVVKVSSGNKGFIIDYFIGDENGFTVANKEASSVRFDANVKTGNSKITFINPVAYFDLKFAFIIPFGYDKYGQVKVTLTDFANSNNKTEILYVKDGNLAYCYVDGGEKLTLSDQFASATPKTVSYSYTSGYLTVGTGTSVYNPLPFESSLCYISIEMIDINCLNTETASVTITDINNQKINGALTKDTTAPLAAVIKTTGIYNIGDVISVKRPIINDVLTPILVEDVSFSIKGNDGSTLIDYDTGETLNNPATIKDIYRVTLDRYVDVTVSYGIKSNVSATKYGKKFSGGSYSFSVENKVKPEIIFTKGYDEDTVIEINLGEEIVVEYEVIDDNTPTSEIYVDLMAIKTENWANFFIFEDNKFKPFEKGTYKIIVIAEDSYKNIETRYYLVKVV